jgi:hypothetical protein
MSGIFEVAVVEHAKAQAVANRFGQIEGGEDAACNSLRGRQGTSVKAVRGSNRSTSKRDTNAVEKENDEGCSRNKKKRM